MDYGGSESETATGETMATSSPGGAKEYEALGLTQLVIPDGYIKIFCHIFVWIICCSVASCFPASLNSPNCRLIYNNFVYRSPPITFNFCTAPGPWNCRYRLITTRGKPGYSGTARSFINLPPLMSFLVFSSPSEILNLVSKS